MVTEAPFSFLNRHISEYTRISPSGYIYSFGSNSAFVISVVYSAFVQSIQESQVQTMEPLSY